MDGCGSVLLTCNLTAALGEDPFDSYNIRVEAVNQTSPAAEITRFKPVGESAPPPPTDRSTQTQTSAPAAEEGTDVSLGFS